VRLREDNDIGKSGIVMPVNGHLNATAGSRIVEKCRQVGFF
jgi:hypothetical protein